MTAENTTKGRSAADVQVAVKPVFVQLLHSGAYEGPCRVGRKEELNPEKEKQTGANITCKHFGFKDDLSRQEQVQAIELEVSARRRSILNHFSG